MAQPPSTAAHGDRLSPGGASGTDAVQRPARAGIQADRAFLRHRGPAPGLHGRRDGVGGPGTDADCSPGREAGFEAVFSDDDAGFIEGHLLDVSADAEETAPGSWGFMARTLPDEPHLAAGTTRHPLKSGMTGTADIVTDERRIVTYFFVPIVKTVGEALGER